MTDAATKMDWVLVARERAEDGTLEYWCDAQQRWTGECYATRYPEKPSTIPAAAADTAAGYIGARPLWVTVYEAGRSYGGPEEGGWWYDTGTVLEAHQVCTQAEAEALQATLQRQFPHTGRRGSVLGGEDYDVDISLERGEDFPRTRPFYE